MYFILVHTNNNKEKRLSMHTSLVALQTGAYAGFCSMKQLGVFLLPHGWDASLLQGSLQC